MKKKIVILGDSISEGIGKKKINYEMFLREQNNNYSYINLARTGTTIKYANEIYDKIKEVKPTYVIIFYGNVDAQIRANISGGTTKIINYIPRRYKHIGMLDPRPFYSRKWYKFILNKIDNKFRKIYKKLVIRFEGTAQWLKINEFEKEYINLINKLKSDNIIPIIVSTIYLDDKYFLNSNIEYKKYNKILYEFAKKNNYTYIDIFNNLRIQVENYGFKKFYSYDHFHPNIEGYKFISNIINSYLK